MRNLYLTNRFFFLAGAIVALFAISFYFSGLFHLAQVLLLLLLALVIVDSSILFSAGKKIQCRRSSDKVMSLSDQNKIEILLRNDFNQGLEFEVIDEVPEQFQMRNFSMHCQIPAGKEKVLSYKLRPVSRGLYTFSNTNVFLSTVLKLVSRRVIFNSSLSLPVYPSIVQMKKYQLNFNASVRQHTGMKRLQRVGHSYEFDHIKKYSVGEDPRSINWKASSRVNELMINYYSDEKSQQVYCILNKSRLMNMPFNGLSLLDYSINTSLTLSNIALQKFDRVGLLSFSDKMGTILKASRNGNQLQKILQALYNETESKLDPNYELLYSAIRYFIPNRSLIFLFTNFESVDSLERNMPILRKINKFHLLVTIIFENSELDHFINEGNIEHDIDIYYKVIARKIKIEKEQICNEMRKYGIQYIYTKPEELSINSINKYLELKSRGLI